MKDINLFRTEDSIYLKKVKFKSEVLKEDSCDGYLLDCNEKEARRIIESLKKSGKKIGVMGGDDVFNRRVVETLKVDYLVSVECKTGRGNLKQRDSGINHVVAKMARDRGIVFVVDVSEISRMKGIVKALRLGRVIQNVKICRKAGCGLKIASFGLKESEVVGEVERRAFGVGLGMSSSQGASAVRF
ncbi:MAG: hypothetical protein KJ592_01620 [Nanoarchaeota archaeon]|nr:hypothetical protein [Nanoarchaeota archaeon]